MAIRKRRNTGKYNSRVINYDGYRFDSALEFEYYLRLKILKLAGEIKDFRVHPEYILAAGVHYVSDFEVTGKDGSVRVVDTKCNATMTPTFRIKARLFIDKFPGIQLIVAKGIYRRIGRKSIITGFEEREYRKRSRKEKRGEE